MRPNRSLPAALIVLTLALAGCSDGDPGTSATDDSSSAAVPTESPADPPTDAPSEEPTDEPTDEPAAGGDGQPVATDQVAFEVPTDWEVVDPTEFTDDQDGGAIEDDPAGGELTDRLGISGDQLLQLMGQADVIVLNGAGAQGGFIDNLNVVHFAGSPTIAELQQQVQDQYATIGATDLDVSTAQTDLGEALLVGYVLPLQGNEIQGRSISVLSGSEVVTVTVSARDAAVAAQVADQVVSTLRAAG